MPACSRASRARCEEETGLLVAEWEGPLYEVRAVAEGLGWSLRCEVHRALAFEGALHVDDPDGIVVDAAFTGPGECVRPARCVLAMGARATARLARSAMGTPRVPRVHLRRVRQSARGSPSRAHVAGVTAAMRSDPLDPARRPGRVLCVGGAARGSVARREAGDRRRSRTTRRGRRGQLRGPPLRRVLRDADGAGAPRLCPTACSSRLVSTCTARRAARS